MPRPLRSIQAKARVARGWSLGLYIAGIAALGAGLRVGGIVAAATGSAAGLTVAAVIAGAGVATGGLSLWESRRFAKRAERFGRTLSEHRLYALAEKHGGTLRVVDVARGLRIPSAEAEALLDELVDEVRVSMRVTDEGEIHYLFRELEEGTSPRVRVAVPEVEAGKETEVEVRSDSELLIKQLNGKYKVLEPKIQPLFLQVWNLKVDFGKIKFTAIPREKNKQADRLVNKALDGQRTSLPLF